MQYPENDAFSRIVIAQGFCTQAQIDQCLKIQSRTEEGLNLGQSLLREGFLSQAQYSRVNELLRKQRK
jgi:hypothetical protein